MTVWHFKDINRRLQKSKARPCTSRGTKVTSCQIFKFLLQTLTSFNFDAAWGTRLSFTVLETSNQYLKKARLSWVLQCSKRLKNCISVSRLMHRAVFPGKGVAINDCDDKKLELFESPPSGVWTLKGSYPMVSIFCELFETKSKFLKILDLLSKTSNY